MSWEVQDPITGEVIGVIVEKTGGVMNFFTGGGLIGLFFFLALLPIILALIATIYVIFFAFLGWWKTVFKIFKRPIPVLIFLSIAGITLIQAHNSFGLTWGEFIKSFFWQGSFEDFWHDGADYNGLVFFQIIWFFSPWPFLGIMALVEKINGAKP